MFMDGEDSDIHSETDIEDTQVIIEPEMAAEEEIEPEPITEPEIVTENEAPNIIMDLINANRENDELDSPDLFSGQNIHQLDDMNDPKDEETIEESETDQDLLEIPSFLRRQSK